jgi:hypothetical protein
MMLMPIISMSQMAMNESIAASCCYRVSLADAPVFQTTLHGGYVGGGAIESYSWKMVDSGAGDNKKVATRVQQVEFIQSGYHFGATSAHTGITDWAKPHAAVQYAS